MRDVLCARIAAFVFSIVAVYSIAFGAPSDYPSGTLVSISSGATVAKIASTLGSDHAVRFPKIFSVLVRLEGQSIPAGTYFLSKKENIFSLAYRFSHGKTGLVPVKVTIPEGTSVRQMAAILKAKLKAFDTEKFLSLARPDEGYLFPDTYFLLPGVSPESVIALMKGTFIRRTASLNTEVRDSGRSETDVIIMASLLEKEGRQPTTRRIIAGILWHRLSLGMPLQVDATFGYILGNDAHSPSPADLTIDSPYNTYKNKGLPPGPIDNPGLEAIEDATTPIPTPYLYYVTDKNGDIFYARTYAEHIRNIEKAALLDKQSSA
ncbi:MAG: endolytic transglycosylase MltG [Patescibacteria group bacterium]|nr:endolytic transglycosylase MltG [Patescibacteria group bacterium]